jgi:hypothetical protein
LPTLFKREEQCHAVTSSGSFPKTAAVNRRLEISRPGQVPVFLFLQPAAQASVIALSK